MMCFTTDLAAQDWANLNRFKSENLKIGLPKENEDRVVFMGNSITEGWIREVPEFLPAVPTSTEELVDKQRHKCLFVFVRMSLNFSPKWL